MVGRAAELARIAAVLERCAEGDSTVLLIGGEAGVGKTRLVDEAQRLARQRGMTVLAGGCVDLGATTIAFAPLREALRDAAVNQERASMASALAAAPALRALAPDALRDVGESDATDLAGVAAQARLFEGWLAFFRAFGSSAVLLVLEDIHWADPSTLDLLQFLARNHRDGAFVVLASFRSDELHRRHPLLPVLARLQRMPGVERLDVERLSDSEIAELVRAAAGGALAADDLMHVQRRSDGNPFYALELAATGTDAPLTRSLHDVLLVRVAALSEPAQRLLRWMAVAGARAPVASLAAAMERAASDLDPLLRECVDQHILVPVDTSDQEEIAFRHVLMQEAIYTELLPGERARCHARMAEVISQSPDAEERAAELAHHWYAAHDLASALTASFSAAQAAERLSAHADAYAHYGRVLELWDRVADAEQRLGQDRVAVLEAAARTAAVTSPDRAAELFREAIRSAGGKVNDERMALLLEQYGHAAYLAGDGVAALDACRSAVEMLPADPPSLARARALARLGWILMIVLTTDEARRVCEDAVEAARAVGSERVEAHALNSLGTTNAYCGELDLGLEQLRASLALATRLNSVEDVARAYANITDVLANSGRFEEAARAGIEGFAYSEAHGLARLHGAVDLAEVGLALYRSGAWREAREQLERAARYQSPGVSEIMVDSRLAMLDASQGEVTAAAARITHVESLNARAVEAQLLAPNAEAAAELALWQGRPSDARQAIRSVLDRLPADRPAYISRTGPLFFLGVRAEADLAVVARAGRRSDELAESEGLAHDLVERLARITEHVRAHLPNFASQAEAWYAGSLAEQSRLAGASDLRLWRGALDAFDAASMRYQQAYAAWRVAEAALATDIRQSAGADALRLAYAIGGELGAASLLGEVELLAKRARVALDGGQKEDLGATLAEREGGEHGLTARELDVIALVAEGRTNREIAKALFITEGTAGAHVSNILGKLGVRSRTEAAAVAHRLQLIPPPRA